MKNLSSTSFHIEAMGNIVEEMHDLMDYFQEIFDCDNRSISDLLTNALLYYCYLPLVLGSIVCEGKPIISLSTA
jgi:hypothetical protein